MSEGGGSFAVHASPASRAQGGNQVEGSQCPSRASLASACKQKQRAGSHRLDRRQAVEAIACGRSHPGERIPERKEGGNAPEDREQRAGQNVLHEIVRVAVYCGINAG